MDWEDKITVKKGNIGERLVREHFEKNGYIVYEPVTEGPHPYDKIVTMNKKHIVIAEVKTKARLNKYAATGFNVDSYKYYHLLGKKYNLPIYIYFVDEMLKKIYGNKLSILEEKHIDRMGIIYPNTEIVNGIILFSLEKMIVVKELTDQQVEAIKKNSSRNYGYKF